MQQIVIKKMKEQVKGDELEKVREKREEEEVENDELKQGMGEK